MKSFKFQVSGSKLPAKMLNLKLETWNLKYWYRGEDLNLHEFPH